MNAKILIVEDDSQISANIYDYLSARGFVPDAAPNAQVALHLLAEQRFDLIVLDLGLPGMSGLSLAQHLRRDLLIATPILMLTARDTLADKEAGFDAGADDYLLKPFSLKELELRIMALLRRASGKVVEQELQFGQLRLDVKTGQAYWQEQALKLTPKTMLLLQTFLLNPQTLLTREQLECAVWGEPQDNSDLLRQHLTQLRRLLGQHDGACPLHTVHGRGYMLVAHP
ncbi:response regulator transcription factor [Chitinibacter bivalviorum]|uniref:Response regulator transcription factor n=1 Tax=Chitinibacter bivalviorum TaxID=2739434 RepID=A0A7H9BM44_9NEIS|nr:response regulator transcription factor [Chitinibacter bivalviorum]QLG89625.1 response regulator transcription factor [Chitinibacter bivalviorum]